MNTWDQINTRRNKSGSIFVRTEGHLQNHLSWSEFSDYSYLAHSFWQSFPRRSPLQSRPNVCQIAIRQEFRLVYRIWKPKNNSLQQILYNLKSPGISRFPKRKTPGTLFFSFVDLFPNRRTPGTWNRIFFPTFSLFADIKKQQKNKSEVWASGVQIQFEGANKDCRLQMQTNSK